MFFRFGCAIVMVVAVSLAGIAIEKQNLELRRRVSRQCYRTEVLQDVHADMRLKTQQLGAPVRLIDDLEQGTFGIDLPDQPRVGEPRRFSLLEWRRAAQ